MVLASTVRTVTDYFINNEIPEDVGDHELNRYIQEELTSMNNLVAKTIIKNKYWVVEQSGNQVATIQAVENGGFVYVYNDQRETYASVKNIKSKYI